MTEKIKLLIVEDSKDTVNISKNILTSKGYWVETCHKDGNAVLQGVRVYQPDVIIIEMFMSNLDAVAVIKAIAAENLVKKPAIIVSSNYDSGFMEREVMQAGAAYFLLKPFDYDMLCERIDGLCIGRIDIARKKERMLLSEVDLEVMVTEMLHQIGMPANIKGYQYVRTAIVLVIENNDMINHVTKELYPAVAKKYKSTASRVERSIRHAIESAWDRGNIEVINSYFGYTIHNQKGKPTNSEFIAMIADKICLKIKAM